MTKKIDPAAKTPVPVYSKETGLGPVGKELAEFVIQFPSKEELQEHYPSFYHPSLDPFITEEYMRNILSDVLSSYIVECLDNHIDDFKYNLCVDLGANVGTFSVLAGLYFHRVVAIEADPYTCDYARATIDYNLKYNPSGFVDLLGYDQTNIELYNLACAAKAGDIASIYGSEDDLGSNMIYDDRSGLHQTSRRCMTIDFPAMQQLVGTKEIDYLKVDIEGSEYDFLLGQDLSHIKAIRMEVHGTSDLKETNRKKNLLGKWIDQQGFYVSWIHDPAEFRSDNLMAVNRRFITKERHENMFHILQDLGRFG